jgi:hypothetical protein
MLFMLPACTLGLGGLSGRRSNSIRAYFQRRSCGLEAYTLLLMPEHAKKSGGCLRACTRPKDDWVWIRP